MSSYSWYDICVQLPCLPASLPPSSAGADSISVLYRGFITHVWLSVVHTEQRSLSSGSFQMFIAKQMTKREELLRGKWGNALSMANIFFCFLMLDCSKRHLRKKVKGQMHSSHHEISIWCQFPSKIIITAAHSAATSRFLCLLRNYLQDLFFSRLCKWASDLKWPNKSAHNSKIKFAIKHDGL